MTAKPGQCCKGLSGLLNMLGRAILEDVEHQNVVVLQLNRISGDLH